MTRTSAWRALRRPRGLRNLAVTGAASAVSATVGALATDPQSDWYSRLDKPRWQPPPIVFPLVWTPLYVDIAVVSAAALTSLEGEGRNDEVAALRKALAVNLVLNAGWSVLFWRGRRPWVSTAWCAVLAASSSDLARRAGAVDDSLRAALLPYPAWCGFATGLNAAIARRSS
jgi:tryptophan-rich sensory protein